VEQGIPPVCLRLNVLFDESAIALARTVVCIVSSTRPEPRVYQPDPPGLMHDDLRLLPPWRGSSLLWGQIFSGDWLIGPASAVLRGSCDPSAERAPARSFFGTGVPPLGPRTVDG
jgi:hypothetical protein